MKINSIDVIESIDNRITFAVDIDGPGYFSVAVREEGEDSPTPDEIMKGTGEGFFYTKTYQLVGGHVIESFTANYDTDDTSYEIWVATQGDRGHITVSVAGVTVGPGM